MPDTPIGSIVAFAGPTNKIPAGWLKCDGTLLKRTDPRNTPLFNVIGTTWGGDGADGFCLPDLRGLFLRGVSENSGVDPHPEDRTSAASEMANPGNRGNAVGSMQPDMTGQHSHNLVGGSFNLGYKHGSDKLEGGGDKEWWFPDMIHNISVVAHPGDESRPKNAYVYWIIRAA